MIDDPGAARKTQARQELGDTQVRRAHAALAVGLFLLVVVTVPLFDLATGGVRPAVVELAAALSRIAGSAGRPSLLATNRELLGTLHGFEDRLEDDSVAARALAGPFQTGLWALGSGNEQVYVGRGGWLFYRPGVDLVTGPGFLEPRQLARRAAGAATPIPDPVPALAELAAALADRGIRLLVMPAPTKAAVHPERLAEVPPTARPLQNPSMGELAQRVEAAGAAFFDPAPLLAAAAREQDRAQFLARDSHWSPGAVERVARGLAARAREVAGPFAAAPASYFRRPTAAAHEGDLPALLGLPSWARPWRRERVELRPVFTLDGHPWEPDPASPVLLLGDSFTNVYSQPGLGWGEGAGLAEQLSYHLGFAVDRIAVNAGGGSAVRRELAARLARGEDPLAGKRLLIYQFAARELASGDWPRFTYARAAGPAGATAQEPTGPRRFRGRVAALAPLPDPATTPYREALVAVLLTDLAAADGAAVPERLLVYTWGMRDRRPLLEPSLRGRRVEVEAVPWGRVSAELGGLERLELPDPELLALAPWWAAELRPVP
jgi:alginate O-acetyltransferase complex protein AlgJ